MTVEICGSGPLDGIKFTCVEVTFDDGESGTAFLCNDRPGYFKQIFVPWDFEHDGIII